MPVVLLISTHLASPVSRASRLRIAGPLGTILMIVNAKGWLNTHFD